MIHMRRGFESILVAPARIRTVLSGSNVLWPRSILSIGCESSACRQLKRKPDETDALFHDHYRLTCRVITGDARVLCRDR